MSSRTRVKHTQTIPVEYGSCIQEPIISNKGRSTNISETVLPNTIKLEPKKIQVRLPVRYESVALPSIETPPQKNIKILRRAHTRLPINYAISTARVISEPTKKRFYVCSYGGCASTVLTKAFAEYGDAYHVHSRYPPDCLEYLGPTSASSSHEWFNGIKIPEKDLNNYYVIYIYRNPIMAISSILRRFEKSNALITHLKNIEVNNPYINKNQIVNKLADLYGLIEFYNNYTKSNPNRNYKIYCVKYEDLFEKKDELSTMLGIGKLNIPKKETPYKDTVEFFDKLHIIYKDLIQTMNNNDFIFTS
jgi:hypothetical protein